MMLMAVAAAAVISFSFQQRLLCSSATWNRSLVDYSSHHDATVDHRRPATGTDIITKRSTSNLNGDSQISVHRDDAVDANATTINNKTNVAEAVSANEAVKDEAAHTNQDRHELSPKFGEYATDKSLKLTLTPLQEHARVADQAASTKPVEPANKNKNMKGGDEKVAVLVLVDSKEERIRNPSSKDAVVGTKVTRFSDQAASTKPVEPTNKNKNKKGGDEKVAVPVVKTSKTMVLALPEHCSAPKTGEIVLKGERHPGTNWITKIIWQNIQGENTIVKDSKSFGWKHGFLPPVGWGEPLSENEILVIVTRDVFTWLPKMMNETYDPIMNGKRGEGFSSFIRAKYANVCQPRHTNFCKKNYRKRAMPYEKADNLVQIRTQKYKQWLSDDPANATYSGSKDSFLKNRIHLRLESLTTDQRIDDNNGTGAKELQRRLIGDPLWDRCVLMADSFREVTSHTKFRHPGQKENRKINPFQEKEKMLEMYSKEDLRFVLSQLDLAFEKRLGYDYSYVYEMLNSTSTMRK
jgi:hypothetical protein